MHSGNNVQTCRTCAATAQRRLGLRTDHRFDLGKSGVGQCAQLIITAILDRMSNEQTVCMKAPGFTLCACRVTKCFRGDEATGDTTTVEFSYVLQTARRTGASVGQAFDHHIAVGCDLL